MSINTNPCCDQHVFAGGTCIKMDVNRSEYKKVMFHWVSVCLWMSHQIISQINLLWHYLYWTQYNITYSSKWAMKARNIQSKRSMMREEECLILILIWWKQAKKLGEQVITTSKVTMYKDLRQSVCPSWKSSEIEAVSNRENSCNNCTLGSMFPVSTFTARKLVSLWVKKKIQCTHMFIRL